MSTQIQIQTSLPYSNISTHTDRATKNIPQIDTEQPTSVSKIEKTYISAPCPLWTKKKYFKWKYKNVETFCAESQNSPHKVGKVKSIYPTKSLPVKTKDICFCIFCQNRRKKQYRCGKINLFPLSISSRNPRLATVNSFSTIHLNIDAPTYRKK